MRSKQLEFPHVEPPENTALSQGVRQHEVFRRLYFHLYSNSDASRAERIFQDIAKLLLLKVLSGNEDVKSRMQTYLNGNGTAKRTLLPVLHQYYPQLRASAGNFGIDDESIRLALSDLDSLELGDSPSIVLGDAFQALMGPGLRGDRGQFFTPRELVRTMVTIANPRPGDKVVDPAAGTGGFLIETFAFLSQRYPGQKQCGPLLGVEKDSDLQALGDAILQASSNGIGRIYRSNSLDLKKLRSEIPESLFDADIVLTNPPFGAKIGIKDKAILQHFPLGHAWAYSSEDGRWYKQSLGRASQDPQLLFLDLCLQLVKPGGLVGIVLPEGVFGNRKTGYVWDYVRSIGSIEAMLDCPRTTFQPCTDTKTNVVFVRKHDGTRKNGQTDGQATWLAVATSCGHDRRGRMSTAAGSLVENDFREIRASFQEKSSTWWSHNRIIEPYYLVPRYHSARAHCQATTLAGQWNGSTVPFGKLIKSGAIAIRKGHEVGADAYGTGEIPFIRTSDIHNWEVTLNPTNGISEEIYSRFRDKQALKPRDILLVVDGRYKIGRSAMLHEGDCTSVVQSHCRILTVAETSPLDPFELLYVLSRREVLTEIRNLVFIQSTLGSIGKRLLELPIPIPSKSEDWNSLIASFRSALELRAKALHDLSVFRVQEPEL